MAETFAAIGFDSYVWCRRHESLEADRNRRERGLTAGTEV